jgi:ankyrin repeat protein
MDQNIQRTANLALCQYAANQDRMGANTANRSKVKQQHKELRLFAYAMNGEIEKLKSLVLAGANVNATSMVCHSPIHGEFGRNTVLMFAASAGNRDAVAFLLKHGANPFACNLMGETAHSLALLNKDHEMVQILKSAINNRRSSNNEEWGEKGTA